MACKAKSYPKALYFKVALVPQLNTWRFGTSPTLRRSSRLIECLGSVNDVGLGKKSAWNRSPRHLSFYVKAPGSGLFSQWENPRVSSALERFTSVFGMRTGGAAPLEPPGTDLYSLPMRPQSRQHRPHSSAIVFHKPYEFH